MIKSVVAAVLAAAASFSACKTTSADQAAGSEVKFGFLDDNPRFLVHLKSGTNIKICGQYIDHLRWAINVWGEAIGRTYTISESCSGDQLINSFGPTDPWSLEQCKLYGFDNRMYVQNGTQPMQMVDCNYSANRNAAVLHETGHLFGMCDQYAESIGNCAESTEVVPGSVMHSANTESLQQDDLNGIRKLAARFPESGGDQSQGGAPNGNTDIQLTGPSVVVKGSGMRKETFSPAATGSTAWVSFIPGCSGPWTGNLVADGLEYTCDNCDTHAEKGPWEFRLGQTLTVKQLGGNLGDGSCAYRITVQ